MGGALKKGRMARGAQVGEDGEGCSSRGGW